MTILPFDEINAFEKRLEERYSEGDEEVKPESRPLKPEDRQDILDEMLDLFLLSYAMGVESVNSDMGTDVTAQPLDVADVVNAEVAGETWEQRVNKYLQDGGTVYDVQRIAETEAHRIANAAAFEAAKKAGATKKIWHCSMLPTSRDTHVYLDGVEAPIDGYFYSFNGGMTQYPGEWGIADEDVNCLCWLTFE